MIKNDLEKTIVQKLNALSYSKLACSAAGMNEEKRERAFTQPVKVIRAEWHKSFPLVENINKNFNGQNNSRAKQ